MSSFKEIVTKAVIGKAKKTSSNTFTLDPEENPNTVLGCWVINHSFNGSKNPSGGVLVNGSFDVNVWYSYDADKKTAVSTRRFNYSDILNVPLKENSKIDNASEIIVRCLKQPTVSNVNIEGTSVKLDIEKEMGVEVVGEAKVKIAIEEDEDDYEEIIDDDEIDEAINEVNEDYLNTNEN